MYHYPRQNSGTYGSLRHQRRQRLIVLAVFLCVAVALVLSILFLKSGGISGDVRAQLISSCKQSISSAINQSNTISSIGGVAAYPKLALVRQYVYHIDQVNRICISSLGIRLAPDETFTTLYQALDAYTASVQSGSSITAAQNALTNGLNSLQLSLNGIQDTQEQ